ncbi:MAG: hypothetical protein RMK30_06090 [Anaerolineae bacterium]|nr:hypothetical protein [Anaerolineae bacterium]
MRVGIRPGAVALWRPWKAALAHAAFYYWFGIADRYAIFLYGHYGAGPFDATTLSPVPDDWVGSLWRSVVFYRIANWFVARLAGAFYCRYIVPEWWRVWLFFLLPLAVALPWLMTTINRPTMLLSVALTTTAIALGIFALAPGRLVLDSSEASYSGI